MSEDRFLRQNDLFVFSDVIFMLIIDNMVIFVLPFFIAQATVNRSKGNRTEMSKSDLIQKSAYCRVSGIFPDTQTIKHEKQ